MARRLLALVVVLLGITTPIVARAHADLDYTLPTDGAAVGVVVTEIAVAFNEAVTLIGPGFEVLDPQGRVLTPFVVTDDDVVFRLQMDPPLGGGPVVVEYTVAAQDGHTIEGNFTFTVAADAPVVTEPPATTAPATVPPATEPPATDSPPATEPPPATTAAAAGTDGDAAVAAATTGPSVIAPTDASTADAPVDDVTVDDDGDGGSTTTLVLLGLGAVVAAAFAVLLMRSRSAS